MISTITLNPCRDRTVVIPSLTVGGLNRVDKTIDDMCGKGVNVSTVLHNLGADTVCLGFIFEQGADELTDALAAKGLRHDFVRVPGKIRTNLKIFEAETRRMTEINESGSFVPEEYIAALREKVRKYAKDSEIVVISGSAPPGVGAQFYGELTGLCREANPHVTVALDADGDLLRNGVAGRPDFLKPNLYELEKLLNKKIGGFPLEKQENHIKADEIVQSCEELARASGASMICVSMGADGALLWSSGRAFYAAAPDVEVRSLQGAGDSMLAGLCAARAGGRPPEDMLRWACAAAGGSIIHEGTELCGKRDFEELYGKIRIAAL
ncbi:MAG: 1-phosphofructokinase family hexose kinase [Defluviitaleaceae bacterium]|nr:1-phosphofructokinase family hexose kinase [Defluviitaleaceae bacterium]